MRGFIAHQIKTMTGRITMLEIGLTKKCGHECRIDSEPLSTVLLLLTRIPFFSFDFFRRGRTDKSKRSLVILMKNINQYCDTRIDYRACFMQVCQYGKFVFAVLMRFQIKFDSVEVKVIMFHFCNIPHVCFGRLKAI